MAKIPFTLEAWLKDKSQKVVDEHGRPVRIICTDADGLYPIIGLVDNKTPLPCGKDGRPPYIGGGGGVLFIVTPEPELSEFEKRIRFTIDEVVDGRYNADNIEDVKGIAKGLLALAREQFIKDGYVIEKKAFHDAVENISDKHLAEMSVQYSIHCKVEDGTRHAVMNWSEFQKVAQKFIDIGKADALKDLPRWKPAARAYDGDRLPRIDWSLNRLVARFEEGIFYLDIRELYKLPRFKEDEK